MSELPLIFLIRQPFRRYCRPVCRKMRVNTFDTFFYLAVASKMAAAPGSPIFLRTFQIDRYQIVSGLPGANKTGLSAYVLDRIMPVVACGRLLADGPIGGVAVRQAIKNQCSGQVRIKIGY